MQNNKNSIIVLCWDYRAQAVVLLAEAVALLAVEVDDVPLLQVGQLYVELPAALGNVDAFDWEPPTHVGQ